ncbi:hypothetical protein C8Z91_02220 [Paenibacillus elgii]|uniref:Tubby C-terminal domain-containing protein n=1 Tax=Paenibacillus elgii TaxID=189691 RepID=A0A2T6G928_9BACL|nr:hypothetical protein [Paenibacillus elgii]PUA40666.1 hypothetical protein C8Z91_02220 [Paenibacillus elgii]
MIYKTKLPLLKMSTAPIILMDEVGNHVGTMRRYYSTKKQKFLNVIFDNIIVNIHVFDQEEKLCANIQEIITMKTMIKDKWNVQLGEESFICETQTKIKTNPQFYYEKSNANVWIKKDFADKVVRFFIDQKVVAHVNVEGFVPPKSCHLTITILDSRVDIYEVASLYYLFHLKY